MPFPIEIFQAILGISLFVVVKAEWIPESAEPSSIKSYNAISWSENGTVLAVGAYPPLQV